jgi:hypothetical protein
MHTTLVNIGRDLKALMGKFVITNSMEQRAS